jgi:murein DD-endopeptidase MepM/ murein hydrolase activator NlpD
MAGRGSARRILAILLLVGCSAGPRGGIVHVVRRGENLFRIGKAYGVSYQELARRNHIGDPARIEVGQEIFVPGATRRLPVQIITPLFAESRAPTLDELPRGSRPFRWPTREGTLSSRFGPRNGTVHDGIDIAAPEGTEVYAARAGRVIYSDQIPGYGNIVIVDHGDGLSTVYAHNSKNEVSEGDVVKEGELVSLVGRSGRTTGANLHFEVRQRNVARNPLDYLPPIATSSIR